MRGNVESIKTIIINEQNQDFDPREYNKDGGVSFDEKIRAAAGKASDKAKELAEEVKEGAEKLFGKKDS